MTHKSHYVNQYFNSISIYITSCNTNVDGFSSQILTADIRAQRVSHMTLRHSLPAAISPILVSEFLLYLADTEVLLSKLLLQLLPYIDILYFGPNPLKQC